MGVINRECPKCGHGNAAAKYDQVFDKLAMSCVLCGYEWALNPSVEVMLQTVRPHRYLPAQRIGRARMSEVCEWTKLPMILSGMELQPFRFGVSCSEHEARGAMPFHPDICPKCGKPVKVIESAPSAEAKP